MAITGQDLIDIRKSAKFSIFLKEAVTGRGFMTDLFARENTPTFSESGIVKERYLSRKSVYSVQQNNSNHINVALEAFEAKPIKPRLFKLEAAIDNEEMSLATYEMELNASFSPASVADNRMAEAAMVLKGTVEVSVEEMISEMLQTGQISGKYMSDAGAATSATPVNFEFQAWQTGTLSADQNLRVLSKDPFAILRDLKNEVKKNRGLKPKYLILGSDVVSVLRNHTMVRNEMAAIHNYRNRITVEDVDGYEADYVGRIEGMEVYSYFGSYTKADGTDGEFFPKDGILFAPSKETGAVQLVYGGVSRREIRTPVAYYLKRYEDEKKGFSSMLLETRVLPALAHSRSIMFKKLPAASS